MNTHQLSSVCKYVRESSDIPQFYQVHCGKPVFGNPETETQVLPFPKFCRHKKLP